MKRKLFISAILICLFTYGIAQDMWKYYSPSDFAARRARVFEKIGSSVAILLGAELPEPFIKFRQDNNFYYLTGVELPDAVLILDGRNKTSTLMVPDRIPGDIKDEAKIRPGADAASLYKMDSVISRSHLTDKLTALAATNPTFYLQNGYEEEAEMTRDRSQAVWSLRKQDPWDGRMPRQAMFMNSIKSKFPGVEIKNLTPIMDDLRWVKDAKEIAVLRACGKIGCQGFDEAMKITRPGVYEYQLVAACDFVYQYYGTTPAYFAIAASGERGLSWHYNANNHPLKDGDVILIDYAPELNYMTTDITRTWPVNGKFSDTQLKFYNTIKEMREKVIAAIKPGVTMKDLQAVGKDVFTKHGMEKYWIGYVGHFVGMAVHDVGSYDKPFVEGVVFNVEPLIEDKDLKIHLRLEDTIVVTATGSENVTNSSPVEPEAIYKLIAEKGIWEK
ncbi:MAG: hypothetical protein C5B52_05605 [Bacteroidetes bacterium]|nr:MAG: hypothetical protein C5B52_05605 [Bacteroidota bacterium]